MRLPPATSKIHPIIVVHAITAGGLHDHYPPDHERVWTPVDLGFGDYERIALYPSVGKKPGEVRYEAVEPALIRPSEMFGLLYKDLIKELKHNLSYDAVPVQPVYPFAYDWRQDNFVTVESLARFVDEVIARTNLMPHDPAKAGSPACDCVDLIGHSMGGIVIAGCIASGALGKGVKAKVRRVVTLGTPYQGATAAIAKLATGLGTLTGRAAKERERTMARITPSVYQLLPSFRGALVDGRLEGDRRIWSVLSAGKVWEAETFQPSIVDTIAEHIHETHAEEGLGKTRSRELAAALLGEMLSTARKFRQLVAGVEPASMLRPAPEGGWLAIVGCGEKTHIATGVAGTGSGRMFDFREAGFSGESWDPRDIGYETDVFTGDETVPVLGALPPWPESWRNTVVVKRQDYSVFGELADRFIQDRIGFHGSLPLLNLAQRWIINFFRPEWSLPENRRRLGQHGKVWGRLSPTFWSTPEGIQLRAAAGIDPAGVATDTGLARETIRRFCEETWRDLIPGLSLSPLP